MKPFLSIIIPNYNGSRTIGLCLDAVFAHIGPDCEVIVVDDGSNDGSRDIVKKYPCRLIELPRNSGASAARNAGAAQSRGDVLFFTDADCLVQFDTIPRIRQALSRNPHAAAIGGTYTPVPHDTDFFSRFQSAFIHYSETRNPAAPDYIATHALVIRAEVFRGTGGFAEDFLPILEDVEFCHRLKRSGRTLVMDPEIQVMHVFHFTLVRSFRNAVRKSGHWIRYSLENRDLFADSGTASREMKVNGMFWLLTVAIGCLSAVTGAAAWLAAIPLLGFADIFMNRELFKAFARAGGKGFGVAAAGYYMVLYPAAVWLGTMKGVARFLVRSRRSGRRPDPLGGRPGG